MQFPFSQISEHFEQILLENKKVAPKGQGEILIVTYPLSG